MWFLVHKSIIIINICYVNVNVHVNSIESFSHRIIFAFLVFVCSDSKSQVRSGQLLVENPYTSADTTASEALKITMSFESLSITHRIHVCYIYGNIYHQYTPNVSIYTSTMDAMGHEVGKLLVAPTLGSGSPSGNMDTRATPKLAPS